MPIATRVAKQHELSEQDDAISKRLVEARLQAEPLPDFPQRLPESLEQAYAIQSASIERWPDDVVGWKVARLSPAEREKFGAERLVGPVFRSTIRRVGSDGSPVMPVIEGGFAAVEAEYVFELGTSVEPERKRYTDEALADMIVAVYAAAEIASSPMANVNQLGSMAVIPDLGINVGLVIGPAVTDWRSVQAGAVSVTVSVDDVAVGEANPDAITGDPLQALRLLIDVAADRGITLPEGSLVSSGAITGVHDVLPTSTAHVEFAPVGGFDIAFEAAVPGR